MLELNQINKFIQPPLRLIQTFPLEGETQEKRRLYLRDEIRTCLIDSRNFKPSIDELDRLMNLEEAPQFKGFNVSISHTENFGGFIITNKEVWCGFDIERRERIHRPLVERISHPREMQEVGDNYAHLWCLKEAAFKALSRNLGLKLVVELQFSEFQPFNGGIFTARNTFANGQLLQGVTASSFSDDCFIYGICCRFLSTLV
ncbi:MAG: 4'-phosphopantetheinyl transferase superfamily protein [Bdellovibrionales bacterium]